MCWPGEEGAVYRPAEVMVPTELFPPATESTDQFTPDPLTLASVAVNCWVAPGIMQGSGGAIAKLPDVGGGVGPGSGPGPGDGGDPAVIRYCEQPVASAASARQAANGYKDRRVR